jgi:hypothetical protein
VSADKLVYKFDLRDDVLFQNGQQFTSNDVRESFEYMLDPAHKEARAPIFNRISHVETDAPYCCYIVLREPYAPWVYFLTRFMGIWPKGTRQQFGDGYFRLTPKQLGTGQEFLRNGSRMIMGVFGAIRIIGKKAWAEEIRHDVAPSVRAASPICGSIFPNAEASGSTIIGKKTCSDPITTAVSV